MVVERIGISQSKAGDFREACLDVNLRFWKTLEGLYGCQLMLKDIDRLRFISEIIDSKPVDLGLSQRIYDVISDVKTKNMEYFNE